MLDDLDEINHTEGPKEEFIPKPTASQKATKPKAKDKVIPKTITEEDNPSRVAELPKVKEVPLGADYRWGKVTINPTAIVRETPVPINVNGIKYYFPYDESVIVQKFCFDNLTKYCFNEGHRIMRDKRTGKNVNRFQKIHHAATWEALDDKYQTKQGFARFARENPDVIMAVNARGIR